MAQTMTEDGNVIIRGRSDVGEQGEMLIEEVGMAFPSPPPHQFLMGMTPVPGLGKFLDSCSGVSATFPHTPP